MNDDTVKTIQTYIMLYKAQLSILLYYITLFLFVPYSRHLNNVIDRPPVDVILTR